MKTNKKVISIILSILCFVFLASCGQGGTDKMVEIPVKTYFDQQGIIVKIPKKLIISIFKKSSSEGGFVPYDSFATIKSDFIKNNPDFKFKEYGDYCLLMTTGESGAMRHYLLTLYSDVNCGVFSPSIHTEYTSESETSFSVSGEQIYYPLHLLHYTDKFQRMSFLGVGAHEVRPDVLYQLNSTKDEFKQFYTDTGCFTIEDAEDGFIVSVPEESPDKERVFEEKYRFQFQEADGITHVMYSKVTE